MKQEENFNVTEGRIDPYSKFEPIIVDDDYFLKPHERFVYMTICRFVNFHTREGKPSIEKIAKKTKIGDKRVKKAIKQLIEFELIEKRHTFKEDGSQSSNAYKVLNVPEWFYEANGRNRWGSRVEEKWNNVPDGIRLNDDTTFKQTEENKESDENEEKNEKEKITIGDTQLTIIKYILKALGNDYKLTNKLETDIKVDSTIYNSIINLEEGKIKTNSSKENILKSFVIFVKKYRRHPRKEEFEKMDELASVQKLPVVVSMIRQAHKNEEDILEMEKYKDEAEEKVENNKTHFKKQNAQKNGQTTFNGVNSKKTTWQTNASDKKGSFLQ